MIDKRLIDLIVCPTSKHALSLAPESTVTQANALIEQSVLCFVNGERVAEKMDQLLVRTDGKIGYAVFGGIPNLLAEEGIVLAKLDT